MPRKKKTHFRDKSTKSSPVCVTGRGSVTDNLADVDCKNCQRMAGNKTTEQGGLLKGEENQLYSVIIEKNGPNRVAVIREIRQFTGLGLKESKDLSDIPQYTNHEVTVMYDVELDKANLFIQALIDVGATVRRDNQTGGGEYFYPGDNLKSQRKPASPPSSIIDELTETVYQMFKDHVCGDPIPLPRQIRPKLAEVMGEGVGIS